MTEIVKQRNGYSCLGAVIAMAAGKTFQDVVNIIGHEGNNGYSWIEAQYYLLHYNMFIGVGFGKPFQGEVNEDIEIIEGIFPFKNSPAIICVQSNLDKNEHHALYWDGKKHYDPSCTVTSEKLTDYEVISIWPLTILQEQAIEGTNRLFPGHKLNLLNLELKLKGRKK